MDDPAGWRDRLGLEPHPEGGWYAETYTADVTVDATALPDRYGEERATLTSIYYLLEVGEYSAFHRLASDELWHFYRGDPLTLYLLDDGLETVTLGVERFQAVVPHGTWFAAEVTPRGECSAGYSLVGCDVSPGFDFADFELATPALAEEYPAHRELVSRLIR